MNNKGLYDLMVSILYGEIIPECKNGALFIGDLNPAISFVTNLEGIVDTNSNKPCLVIKDKDMFNKYIYDYLIESINFYYDGLYTHDNIKSAISFLIANLTDIELSDPIKAIQSRTNMLKIDISEDIKTSFLNYDCDVKVSKLQSFLETPYAFNININNGEDLFKLPSVMFGIDNDKCVIYAIQNKDNSNNNLKKKLNRLFYKFNDGVEDNFDSETFNITDITMSFVASIIMFINYLNEKGISKVEVKVNTPIRYNNHFESNKRRLNYKQMQLDHGTITMNEYKEYADRIEKQNNAYKSNIILKLLRTFYRVSSYGNVLRIDTMPFSVSDSIMMTIREDGTFDNKLCSEIYKKNDNKKSI